MASVTSQDSSSNPNAGSQHSIQHSIQDSIQGSTSSSTSSSVSETTRPWAIVTGGSRGLGFETAKGLAAKGYRLVLVAKDQERLRLAAEEINSHFKIVDSHSIEDVDTSKTMEPSLNSPHDNHVAHFWPIDFEATTSEALAGVQDSARKILETYQPIWGLPKVVVIAHGVMSAKMSKTLRTDVDEWRRVMSTNLDSVFALVNLYGSAMSEARDGRIIIYSACLGRMSGPGNAGGLAPYRISKAGVNALVRNLAHETGHGSRGFLIDAVCPNHSRTDMGGADAPRSAQEGAACAIWLATRPFTAGQDQTGLLWEDNEVVPW